MLTYPSPATTESWVPIMIGRLVLMAGAAGLIAGAAGNVVLNHTTAEAAGGQTAVVTKIVDGDTINVQIDGQGETVRLIGIDTPEYTDGRCAAETATRALERYIKDGS